MCYKFPGPRCSAHARRILNKAYIAKINNPEDYDKYSAWRDALAQFEMTPEGQKELKRRIEETTDFDQKYNLTQHLQDVKRLRAEAIAAIGAEDIGDLTHEAVVQTTKPVRSSAFPEDPYKDEPLISNDFDYRLYGLDFTYDSYACGDDGGCTEYGYYCHNQVYEGLEMVKITAEEYLQKVFDLGDKKPPTEWTKRLKEIDFMSYITVEASWGYYGEEASIVVSDVLKREIENMYYGLPNATDHCGALVYARQEGIDTTGLTPVEAIKKTVTIPQGHKQALNRFLKNAQIVMPQKVRISEIVHVPTSNYSYDMSNISATTPAGILIKENEKYVLVGGEERFNGVQATNKKFWRFLVLMP